MANVQSDFNILKSTLDLIGIEYKAKIGNKYNTILLHQDDDMIYLYFSKDGEYDGGTE